MRHWLQIRRFWLKSLNIEAPGAAAPGKQSELQTKFGLEMGKPTRQPDDFFLIPLVLHMDFEADPETGPLAKISTRVEAHFSIPWETPTYLLTRDLVVNMLTLAYGNIRGIVASATGVCRGGPFWLPTISMDALFSGFCEGNDNQPLRGIEDLRNDFTEARRQRGLPDEDGETVEHATRKSKGRKNATAPKRATSRPSSASAGRKSRS